MKVIFSGPAREQTNAIDKWWRENRPSAPGLFAEEVIQARHLLEDTPDLGAPYKHGRVALFRRVILHTHSREVRPSGAPRPGRGRAIRPLGVRFEMAEARKDSLQYPRGDVVDDLFRHVVRLIVLLRRR